MKLDRLHLTLGLLLALGVAFRAAHEHSRKSELSSTGPSSLDRQIGQVTAKRSAQKVKKAPTSGPKAKGAQQKATVAAIDAPRHESTPVGAMPALTVRTLPSTRASIANASQTPPLHINLDLASATAIESLPRIGPALAQRIVQDRAANGPFGSLAGLDRVKGVGPALQKAIAPYVTFSSAGRPSTVATVPQPAPKSGKGKARRRPSAGTAR